MTMHGKREQGVRKLHCEPCNSEQRNTGLSGVSATTGSLLGRSKGHMVVAIPGLQYQHPHLCC